MRKCNFFVTSSFMHAGSKIKHRKRGSHEGRESSSSLVYASRCRISSWRCHEWLTHRREEKESTNPFSCPGNLRLVLTPHITRATSSFKWLKLGWSIFNVFVQMLYLYHNQSSDSWISLGSPKTNKASLSRQIVRSLASRSWWIDSVALYGSTTVSET